MASVAEPKLACGLIAGDMSGTGQVFFGSEKDDDTLNDREETIDTKCR